VKAADKSIHAQIHSGLEAYEEANASLPGILESNRRDAFVEQVIGSVHRREYINRIRGRPLSELRCNPRSELFDPVKAAIIYIRNGDTEEACWLAFLSVHFGRHRSKGWRYCAAVYAGVGAAKRWDWPSVVREVQSFADWMTENSERIRKAGGGFGNHRKYESLAATSLTVLSYVSWVGAGQSQMRRFGDVIRPANGDQYLAFDRLYQSLNGLPRFGRTARFDYLTLLSRLGLLAIASGRAYLQGATGPLKGTRLLFDDLGTSPLTLDERLIELDRFLNVGLDVLEDALCNWQKHPSTFVAFRG
jgi:hypothetical protein